MCKKLTCFVLACLLALCMTTASRAQDPHNVAMKGTVTVSSTGYGWTPDRAIDGNIDTGSHSADNDPDKWLEVELDQVYALNAIEVVNRASCCWERIATVVVKALDADRNEIYVSEPIAEADALQGSVHVFDNGGAGFADVRYIRLEGGTNYLQIMEVRALATVPFAWGPIPADGAIEVDTTTLEWTLGDTAVSSKVYLSSDATIDDADLLGETALNLQVVTLDSGATYYWRVDEIDADGNVTDGDVWSFSTLPLEAHFPSPADGDVWQPLDVKLSWTPGKDAIMHSVNLGTDPAMLLPVSPMQLDASYDPGVLQEDTVYYWSVDEFALGVTNPGPVWSFKTLDPEIADNPSPSDGAVDISVMPTLDWTTTAAATQHDVYLSKDQALVATGDASVLVSQQADTGYTVADALGRGTTLYWKVDVTTADGKMHPGFVYSFRVADQNTDNWAVAVGSAGEAAYLDTYVQSGPYDVGALSGDITYEFIVNCNPDETEVSMALIGRIGHGDTTQALKYEQYNNTGNYGATIFGDVDLDYGVPIARGEYTHLVFVSTEAAGTTDLYVNGVLEGSVPRAITLAGVVGIGQAIRDPEGAAFIDPFDGEIFGVAIYDRALTADEIAANADKYFNPIPITDPDMLIYYDFESGAGDMAIDQSGHSNHGQFMGTPEWADGLFGKAVSIVLEDIDYIEAAPLNIVSNTVSVTGWVKHDESPAAWSGILTHRGTSPGCLGLQHNGTELRYMWGADVYWSFSSGLNIPNGEWYFAAVTISPDQGKLYLNGVEQTATNVAPHEPTNFDSVIYVGADIGNSTGRVQTSLIDEVRFYNRTLTDVEVLNLGQPELVDVTAPGDTIQGVPNDGDWPGNEPPVNAIDDVVRVGGASSKYLHRKGGSMATGFQVEPAMGPTIVTGLTLTTANDDYGRDPTSFELSGSNESIDGPYELIAAGDVVDFAQVDLWPRYTINATAITFENATPYKYYQIVFPTLRSPTSPLMQIAEVELLGVPVPVGHWPLDDGAGDVAVDLSGNGNDGVINNPNGGLGPDGSVWVDDPERGTVISFDGTAAGAFVRAGEIPQMTLTNNFTWTFWAKHSTENTADNDIVLGNRMDENAVDFVPRQFIKFTPTKFEWHMNGNGNDNLEYDDIPADVWLHHAVVKTADRLTYYRNGVEASSGAITQALDFPQPLYFGGDNEGSAGENWAGLMSDVRIYNCALSGAQIADLAGL